MMKKLLFLFFSFAFLQTVTAVEDYHIEVTVKNYEQDKLILAHYLGSTILVDDTARISKTGSFVFNSKKNLPAGVYLLVVPPDNQYVEIFITEAEKKYSLTFDATTLTKDITFENGPDNTIFYDYVKFSAKSRAEMEGVIQTIQEGRAAEKDMKKEEATLAKLQQASAAYKENIIQKYPNKLATTILKSNKKLIIPVFEGAEESIRLQEYLYRRAHFFDYIRTDVRFFRSKICNDMINFYMDNLTVPHPDSIIQSVDEVLNLVAPDSIVFRKYFFDFLNKYYASEYIGMDAVFVHLVKEYTMKGKTDFLQEETRAKITKDALLWDKTLIGKTSPNLENYELKIEESIKIKDAEDENKRFVIGDKSELNDIDKPYTVVIFWAPDCSHCKKSMPVLVDFYEKHVDSVEVFAVCHISFKQFGDCAQALKDYKAINWINTVDPYYKYVKNYSIETTPLILLLDENKKVFLKKIAADKLEVAIEQMNLQKQTKE